MAVLPTIDPASLRIVKYPDPRLSQPSAPIERVDGRLSLLVDRMFEIMYAANGLGLAAPQVGVPIRLFVANPLSEPGGETEGVYINPEITDRSGSAVEQEGCLSFPGLLCRIKRARQITISAADLEGNAFTQNADGLLARILQHEIDHVDGTLLSDRMSITARMANRHLLKDLEERFA